MTKILIFSQDVIGKSMAGPGIRSWEFSKALAAGNEVTLAAPNQPDISHPDFTIMSYQHKRVASFMGDYDVIITQTITPAMAYLARRQHVRLILDAYDPILLENLEIFRGLPLSKQRNKNRRTFVEMKLSLMFADAVICASEKQRDLWLGSLMALDRITPAQYDNDVSLRSLIDVVPFGVQNEEPEQTAPGFRHKLGIAKDDKVLLWGGGIWNWFDPLTLIRAVDVIKHQRTDVKLVFMGLKHPNDKVGEMQMARTAVDLARELNLLDSTVFFNYGWVPYDERQNHFLEADIGVSTHFDHLETRFSFRTRILDYFWTKLPIVATQGDSMGDLIEAHHLGKTVEYEDVEALAQAIIEVLEDKAAAKKIDAGLTEIREIFRWNNVVSPIKDMVASQSKLRSGGLAWSELRVIFSMYIFILQDVRADKGIFAVVSNIFIKIFKIIFRRT